MKEVKPIALVKFYRGIPDDIEMDKIVKKVEDKLEGYNVLVTFDFDEHKDTAEIEIIK